MEEAPVVAHVSVVVCPALTEVGFAMNCAICGTAAICTETETGVLFPPVPLEVAV